MRILTTNDPHYLLMVEGVVASADKYMSELQESQAHRTAAAVSKRLFGK